MQIALVGQIFLTPELCFLRLPKESPRNREKALDKQLLERPLPIHLRIPLGSSASHAKIRHTIIEAGDFFLKNFYYYILHGIDKRESKFLKY